MIGTAAVSRACSAYIDSLLGGMIRNYTLASISSSIGLNSVSEHVDIFALIIVFTFVIFLTCGVKVTSYLNNLFSLVNIGVILIIIVVGFYFSDINNWKNNFMAYGWKGVFAGSATCFYGMPGFVISMSGFIIFMSGFIILMFIFIISMSIFIIKILSNGFLFKE